MKANTQKDYTIEDFWFLKLKPLWAYFKSESLAFKAICGYIFVEYFRPQSIFPVIDFLPWAQLFLTIALVSLFADKKVKLKWTGLHTFVLLFAIAIHLSFLTAFNVSYSLKNYIFFIQWIIVFFLVTSIITTKERFYVFFLVVLALVARFCFQMHGANKSFIHTAITLCIMTLELNHPSIATYQSVSNKLQIKNVHTVSFC